MKKFLAVILAVCMMFSVTSFAFAASGEEVDVEPLAEDYTTADVTYTFSDKYGNDLGTGKVVYGWDFNEEAGTANITSKTFYSYPLSSNYRISATYSSVTSTSFVVKFSFTDTTGTHSTKSYSYKITVRSDGASDQKALG